MPGFFCLQHQPARKQGVYGLGNARLAAEKGWSIAADGERFRRVVASPRPKRIFEIRPIQWLLEHGRLLICAGGGGIPTAYDEKRQLKGIEAVIDKDLSALLAEQLLITTDLAAVYLDWGLPPQKAIARAHPDELEQLACARHTGKPAVIGALGEIPGIVQGTAGTRTSSAQAGIGSR